MQGDFIETHIGYIKGDSKITFDTGEQKLIRDILKKKEKYPDEVDIKAINYDLNDKSKIVSIVAEVPLSWFKRPSPQKKMNLSEEQKQASRERMQAARNAKG